MERMKKPKFIKEIEKSEGKERAKCGRWYIRVYGELDHKPMVELESLEIIVKELHKLEEKVRFLEECLDRKEKLNEEYRKEIEELEEENKKLKSDLAFERTMLDNVRAEYKSLQNVIKKLKKDLAMYEQLREQLFGGLEPEDLYN